MSDPINETQPIDDHEAQDVAPGVGPRLALTGHPNSKSARFFKLPTRIGKLLGGSTDYHRGDKPLQDWLQNLVWTLAAILGLGLGLFLMMTVNSDDDRISAVLFLLPPGIAFFAAYRISLFSHANAYLGTEGFAFFQCHQRKSNLAAAFEVRWDEMTDICVKRVDQYVNGAYTTTLHEYFILDRNSRRTIAHEKMYCHRKWPVARWPMQLVLFRVVEAHWTKRLTRELPPDPQDGQPVTFHLLLNDNVFQPFVTIAPGSLTVMEQGQPFTYRFRDIQRIFCKNGHLRIQHKNFESVLLVFRKGNESFIPLNNLCNQQFFFHLLERYMGRDFVAE